MAGFGTGVARMSPVSVAVPAGGLGPAGQPKFVTSKFGAGHAPTRVSQPRIYYGVQPRGAEPWVVVGTTRPEIEKPLSGDAPEPNYHYSGSGGIPLGGLLRRSVFALRFGGEKGADSYRAFPVLPGRLSINALRRGMDAMARR